MTLAPGLCSITLRSSTVDEVITIACRAGIEGIEWGADVHAPPAGGPKIDALAARCRDAGLDVPSYGSYLGMAPADGDDAPVVDAVLDTAAALGAPMVRIWTELGVGPTAPDSDRRRVIERTAALVDRITDRGFLVAFEFHPATLTETAASANALLDALDRPDTRTHWQPDPALGPDVALAELGAVAPRLAHLHVFAWRAGGIGDRHPLVDGAQLWVGALQLAGHAAATLPGPRYALCEYVRDDDPEQLVADARVLRRWLDELEPDDDHGRS